MEHTLKQKNSECHQIDMWYYHMVVLYYYNPSEEEANIKNLDNIYLKKLKTSVTRVTI